MSRISLPPNSEVVTGVKETIQFLNDRTELIASATAVGMLKCAEKILELGNYYVPKDTLALVTSGRVEFTGKGFLAKAYVIYGNEEAYYALWVHEDLDKFHEPPTQAKWLERATREMMPDLDKIIKGELTTSIRFSRDYTTDSRGGGTA